MLAGQPKNQSDADTFGESPRERVRERESERERDREREIERER